MFWIIAWYSVSPGHTLVVYGILHNEQLKITPHDFSCCLSIFSLENFIEHLLHGNVFSLCIFR